MTEVESSRIYFKSRPGEYVSLYEWDGEETGEEQKEPEKSNPLAPNGPPLSNPQAQSLAFHNTPDIQSPQTPAAQTPGGKVSDETPGGIQTPSQKPTGSKGMKGLFN